MTNTNTVADVAGQALRPGDRVKVVYSRSRGERRHIGCFGRVEEYFLIGVVVRFGDTRVGFSHPEHVLMKVPA